MSRVWRGALYALVTAIFVAAALRVAITTAHGLLTVVRTLLTVGVGNHRIFVLMLVTVQIAIFSFYALEYTCEWTLTDFKRTITQESLDAIELCVLPKAFCAAARQDGMIVYCTGWIIFAMFWLLILLGVQLSFAAREVTTYEASNMRKHGFMAAPTSNRAQSGLQQYTEQSTPRYKPKQGGLGGFMQALVGTNIAFGAAEREKIRAAEKRNPFNRGVKYNLYGTCAAHRILHWW